MFLSLVQKRRSIRRYQEKPVEAEKIDKLIEVALRSPSSRGFNPWEFIVVTDQDLLNQLSKAKPHGASFLRHASLGIVVCADPEKCDVWVEDASIASILIHLAAESMGLGSCWIQIRKRMYNDTKTSQEYVCELLNIPEPLNVESIIAIGYPAEKKPPHRKEELGYEKVYFNQYGESKHNNKPS
ncbi:MAG: nitroreductase family protein [Desulfobacterales bacterium]|nr:MAG: nitroreductase family protein [Desulfobacterales bacterium]